MKHAAAVKQSGPVIELRRNRRSIASHMRDVIRALGEDTERDGLVRTPERIEKALAIISPADIPPT